VDIIAAWKNILVIFALPKLSCKIMVGGSALQQVEVKLEGSVLLAEQRCALTCCQKNMSLHASLLCYMYDTMH
jgi:hypothetical protein